MASRYGSENFALEFRDLQATTLSLDHNGELALLAGRKYLAILNLSGVDCPGKEQILVKVPFGGKYEISNTQWSKAEDGSKHMAIASSQRCDVFELTDSSELKCISRLRGHTRVITDLDWCSIHPTLLATSSFDSYVHIWDIRMKNSAATDKPQFSLTALDGASQVRWNKFNEDILASCDGGHIKIWDLRKPGSPSEFLPAHAAKINGLEWANVDTVITAAQDCTVKFCKTGTETPLKTKGPVLSCSAPVWRARPAPFGRGIITQCVPILRRDSGLLSLWDWQIISSPIFTFQAFDIVEFAWRKSHSFDLLTWSRDQVLRIWTLPMEIVQLCGGDDGIEVSTEINDLNFNGESGDEENEELSGEDTPSGSPKSGNGKIKRISTSERRSRKSSSPSPMNRRDILKTEFDIVESNKPDNITFDQVDLDKGLLRFSWSTKNADSKVKGVSAGLLMSFPTGYPAAPPTFLVTNASSEVDKNHVVKTLRTLALQLSKQNERCLGKCIQQFSVMMKNVKTLEDLELDGYFPTRGVSNVPFPRTSGARFCAVGMLVCFGRPSYLKRVKTNCDTGTPRSLSALGPYLNQFAMDYEDTKHRKVKRHDRKKAGLVTCFDVSVLLPFQRSFAEEYIHIVAHMSMRKSACDTNLSIANNNKKSFVGNAWEVCSKFAEYSEFSMNADKEQETIDALHYVHRYCYDEEEDRNWLAYHPLGCELIHLLITHFATHGDVQTAASISCLFTVPPGESDQYHSHRYLQNHDLTHNNHSPKPIKSGSSGHRQTVPRLTIPKWWTKGVGSPYHTVHGSDTQHVAIISPMTEAFFRQNRSNSWSDSLDEIRMIPGMGPYDGVMTGTEVVAHNNYHPPSNKNNRHGLRQTGIIRESSVVSINDLFSSGVTNGNNLVVGVSKPLIHVSRGYALDSSLTRVYDRNKKSYAEVLYRWGLLKQRAEVLKNLSEVEVSSASRLAVSVACSVLCKKCNQKSNGPTCFSCKKFITVCSICRIPTKGLGTFCCACGHGGHTCHLMQWFRKNEVCPKGCGCKCIEENAKMFDICWK